MDDRDRPEQLLVVRAHPGSDIDQDRRRVVRTVPVRTFTAGQRPSTVRDRVLHEFVEDGVRMGVALTHPNGGPDLALRLDPDRAKVAAGFDYFAIGVPGREAIEALAAALAERGDHHQGVLRTPVGWVLLGVEDPDGHAVRFYTVPLELPPDGFGT